MSLDDLSSNTLAKFTNSSMRTTATTKSKFSIIKGFVEFYATRREMPLLVLEKPSKPRYTRRPFIYSNSQIRTLLDTASKDTRRRDMFDGKTFRMILLLLYATGISHDEVLVLRRSSVDLGKRLITISGIPTRSVRRLPIGLDLRRELTEYLKSTRKRCHRDDLLFRRTDGQQIRYATLSDRFRVLCKAMNIAPTAEGHMPRILDLRFTFAVHRFTHWIRNGKSLNDLIPALSTYMGYSTLTRAEQFLSCVPERFREDLRKLSSAKGRKHWRDNSQLLDFLNSL